MSTSLEPLIYTKNGNVPIASLTLNGAPMPYTITARSCRKYPAP